MDGGGGEEIEEDNHEEGTIMIWPKLMIKGLCCVFMLDTDSLQIV